MARRVGLTGCSWEQRSRTHSAWQNRPFRVTHCHFWCLCEWPGWRAGNPRLVNTAGSEENGRTLLSLSTIKYCKKKTPRLKSFHGGPQLERYLSADSSNLSLIHAGLRDHIRQRPAGQVLHHHKQLLSHQETDAQTHTVTHCYRAAGGMCGLSSSHLSKKLTMLGFFSSFITRISLMISSFLGCFWRLICLMATWKEGGRERAQGLHVLFND